MGYIHNATPDTSPTRQRFAGPSSPRTDRSSSSFGWMNPDAATDQTPVSAFLRAGVTQPGKPLHRYVDDPPVLQANDQFAADELDVDGARLFRRRNIHATSP